MKLFRCGACACCAAEVLPGAAGGFTGKLGVSNLLSMAVRSCRSTGLRSRHRETRTYSADSLLCSRLSDFAALVREVDPTTLKRAARSARFRSRNASAGGLQLLPCWR